MSTGNVAPSASMDEAPVRQNFLARPAMPPPVSAPPTAAGMVVSSVSKAGDGFDGTRPISEMLVGWMRREKLFRRGDNKTTFPSYSKGASLQENDTQTAL